MELGVGRISKSLREKWNSEERPIENLPGNNASSSEESKEKSNEKRMFDQVKRQQSPHHGASSVGSKTGRGRDDLSSLL